MASRAFVALTLLSVFFVACLPVAAQTWNLTGNAITDPLRDFIGTTNNQPLSIRTNNGEAVHIDSLGKVGIGTGSPDGTLHVVSGSTFQSPQVIITQTTPLDFARLQFRSFEVDPDSPGVPRPFPLWDIAAGHNVLNFFRQDTGNVLTLTSGKDFAGTSVLSPRIGIGTENPQTALHVIGTATVSVLQITGGSDVAEPFLIAESVEVEAGSIMSIDEYHPGKLKISNTAYDRKVAGVVSGAGGMRPGVTLEQLESAEGGSIFIALSGRVFCRADTSNGSIEPGDLLTTSGVAGHAMKVTDYSKAQGAIIGKALSSLQEGTGLVLVLAHLQ